MACKLKEDLPQRRGWIVTMEVVTVLPNSRPVSANLRAHALSQGGLEAKTSELHLGILPGYSP